MGTDDVIGGGRCLFPRFRGGLFHLEAGVDDVFVSRRRAADLDCALRAAAAISRIERRNTEGARAFQFMDISI